MTLAAIAFDDLKGALNVSVAHIRWRDPPSLMRHWIPQDVAREMDLRFIVATR